MATAIFRCKLRKFATAIDSKGPRGLFERDTNIPVVYTPFIADSKGPTGLFERDTNIPVVYTPFIADSKGPTGLFESSLNTFRAPAVPLTNATQLLSAGFRKHNVHSSEAHVHVHVNPLRNTYPVHPACHDGLTPLKEATQLLSAGSLKYP